MSDRIDIEALLKDSDPVKIKLAQEELNILYDRLEEWMKKGEKIFENPGFGFMLGMWWAGRPWRIKCK